MKTQRPLRGAHKERGLVVVIVTIAMLVILGVTALAIDINHAYMNRTKLQNGVDAAALAAAVILDKNGTEAQAETAANAALTKMSGSDGNAELDMTTADISVTFNNSSDFSGGACVIGGDCYVRVVANNLDLNSFFMQMFSDTKQVGATAVAGPSAGGGTCNIVPMAVCAIEPSNEDTGGYSGDNVTALKLSANESEMGPGNFHLLDLDVEETDTSTQKDNHIRRQLAGSYDGCVYPTQLVRTKPGSTVGPVGQGLNTRFGVYKGGTASESDLFMTDTDTQEATNAEPNLPINDLDYSHGQSVYAGKEHGYTGNGRREISVPIIDCSSPGSGSDEFPVVTIGCFFLLEKAPDNSGGHEAVHGEFIEDGCTVQNSRNNGASSTAGPYRIVLYKDPFNEDS